MTPEEFRYRDLRSAASASASPDAAATSNPAPAAELVPQVYAGSAQILPPEVMTGDADHASAQRWIETGQRSTGGQQ